MTAAAITPRIPVSVGELIDKITILEIKQIHLRNFAALENVRREQDLLYSEWAQAAALMPPAAVVQVEALRKELRTVNQELWHIEDFKRAAEQSQDFGPEFISAARHVYIKNDYRAQLKHSINTHSNSLLREEKSHNTLSTLSST